MLQTEEVTESPTNVTPAPPAVKIDWYQTESQVIVVFLSKNINPSSLEVKFLDDSLTVSFQLKAGTTYNHELHLAHKVVSSKCSFTVFSTKLEIKLPKAEGLYWSKLEADKPAIVTNVVSRNWDKVVSEFEEDQPQGEAALNALFQKIYNDGTDEVKRAMNKSFQESRGTELNTNWESVSKDKVSVKPPEGMEWKTWD